MHNYKIIISVLLIAIVSIFPASLRAEVACSIMTMTSPTPLKVQNLTESAIAKELGWIPSNENRCGGYYFEPPFTYATELLNKDLIQVTSDQMLFAQHGTSIGQGKVTITRYAQQIVANKAFLYRDPTTGKLSAIDLIDNVTLREPNSLVIAKSGHFDLKTKGESLYAIFYRTAIYSNREQQKNLVLSNEELQAARKITQLSAWGRATEFKQEKPKIFTFKSASYSTCPPTTNVWKVRASDIILDKNTGRGTAYNARLYLKEVPIFYTPYLNFPIDARRQTGFLTPTMGSSSNTGAMIRAPFYWNMAPNYDSTITPAFLSRRGMQFTEMFRYLTTTSQGVVTAAALPSDKEFADLKDSYQALYHTSTDPTTQAELRRLENASDTRKSFSWQNSSRFNKHWSNSIDYTYVSDDYYLGDLNNNFSQITQNQLLQQAQVSYQGEHWSYLGRAQGYQTLHPLDQTIVQNQYTRLPQLVMEGDYSNMPMGLDYFMANDLTHFDISKTPGTSTIPPIGNRLNIQPGVMLPFNRPYFFIIPRLQFALTKYELQQVTPGNPSGPSRALPIFDISSGLNFDRDIQFFHQNFRQTLEPQLYYTYIPFKDQSDIPIFDTTLNTLTYDELFMYNRFSGLDRIGDANQIAYGFTTRLIDQQSGYEKLRAGVGQIIYFRNRDVTLCGNSTTCNTNYPGNSPSNTYNKSPLSGMLTYSVNPAWNLTGNSIWDPQKNAFNNQSITLHYEPDARKIINMGYGYVRGGDIQVNDAPNSDVSNLKQTDLSFAWPLTRDWSTVGRWTQNWNHHRFQNLLYGLQYDSCCWAVRFVTGRAFASLNPSNTYKYNTQFFIQFALKGLGNYGNADPSQLLSSSVSGYQSNFGQDY
ncbi:MAG: LPS assembly protein LptD [Gammaproteobacteria bacterium]